MDSQEVQGMRRSTQSQGTTKSRDLRHKEVKEHVLDNRLKTIISNKQLIHLSQHQSVFLIRRGKANSLQVDSPMPSVPLSIQLSSSMDWVRLQLFLIGINLATVPHPSLILAQAAACTVKCSPHFPTFSELRPCQSWHSAVSSCSTSPFSNNSSSDSSSLLELVSDRSIILSLSESSLYNHSGFIWYFLFFLVCGIVFV